MKKISVCACFALFLACVGCASVSVPDYKVLAQNTLDRMNAAYADGRLETFLSYVDKTPVFDYENFAIAVENDMNGFVSMRFDVAVKDIFVQKDAGNADKAPVLFVKLDYTRQADTYRFGRSVKEGETVLAFKIADDFSLKLTDMSEPYLYGLIVP